MWFLWFVFIGIFAGWLAGRVMNGNGFGFLGDAAIGILGAIGGGVFLFRSTGVELGFGRAGPYVAAFIGAMFLLFIVRLFTGRRSGRKVWS